MAQTYDFRPQRRNANKHTQRGLGQLEASMRKHGYVAPMTAAADGEIIDGSARLETGATVFGDDVLVVEHDGTKPIIMVRTDIESADSPQAREIAYAANRIAQIDLDFDAEVILEDLQAGVDLSDLWFDAELDELLNRIGAETKEADSSPQLGGLEYRIVILCASEGQQTELLERFESEGLNCQALIS